MTAVEPAIPHSTTILGLVGTEPDDLGACRYMIGELIGAGGFGHVYLGTDRRTNMQVALKTVVGGGPYRHLEREFDILAQLSHPNIVRVYEKFSLNGRLYFAMEKISGRSLHRAFPIFPAGPLSDELARLFDQLHDALHYLHENHLVHGELSPDNLLVTDEGDLKLIDLEHCRRLGVEESEYWPDGIFAGTPLYMSPEHLRGTLLPESDYFVMGTLVAEYLCGKNPFEPEEWNSSSISEIIANVSNRDSSAFLREYCNADTGLVQALVFLLSHDTTTRRNGWRLLHERLVRQPPSVSAPRGIPKQRSDAGGYLQAESSDQDEYRASPAITRDFQLQSMSPGMTLDNESRERLLVGQVYSIAAAANQIAREVSVSDHGIDMEIEFKNDRGQATGSRLYLQLKSGDSHLRARKSDGTRIFGIRKSRHAEYWADQSFPMMLVLGGSSGLLEWMEIGELLREQRRSGSWPAREIIFHGEPFDAASILRWRRLILGSEQC